MADKEHAWITTTTLPDGTFDFFKFMAWLQNATLLELQIELLYVETCADEYEQLAGITYGKDGERMKQKANLYNSLWCEIDNEISNRTNPAFVPVNPN